MKVLAIETSCDDTGVALLDVRESQVKILADFVSSQNEIHAPYGGVVPNLAVRAHYKNLPILLEAVLGKIDPEKIDLIAATNGPGLEPCLWAGINNAKVLAKALGKPIVGVNHLEGHIAANFFAANSKLLNYGAITRSGATGWKTQNSKLLFPAICLIVSGGHTQLVFMKKIGEYKVIGQTRDDAAGEAFDKVAKMLGLGYPGGPEVALLAKKGVSDAFQLPRPMIDSKDFDFSFSGLKTAVRYLLQKLEKSPSALPASSAGQALCKRGGREREIQVPNSQFPVPDICASFQQAAIDVLVDKTIKAAQKYKAKAVMLAGGVAANKELHRQMENAVKKTIPNSQFLVPSSCYCTDNAVMIGLAGYWKFMRQGKGDRVEKIEAQANLNF